MPMHDWTKVSAGVYHNFRYLWLASIMDRLNAGLLPKGLFAMAEQGVDDPEDDLTMTDQLWYARKSNRIAIHRGIDTVVAVIDIVSPGNKESNRSFRDFATKSATLIRNGVYLCVIDPFPPGPFDPQGLHQAIWLEAFGRPEDEPHPKPLRVVSYDANSVPNAYFQSLAVGEFSPVMPLFIDAGNHIMVPLEETYQATWNVLPIELREVFGPSAK